MVSAGHVGGTMPCSIYMLQNGVCLISVNYINLEYYMYFSINVLL